VVAVGSKCRVCKEPAIIDLPRHNANFCAEHFLELCRRQVVKAIEKFDMLSKNDRVLVAVSGGKDSLAVAYLLRPHWDRLTFYHVDTGDLLPEVREIVDGVEALVPRFVRIEVDSDAFHRNVGLPSDLVPTSCTNAGVTIGASTQRIVDRYDCCASNIMAPMHHRMLADGVSLVIRGTKRADMAKLPAESGPTGGGYDLWLPIVDWSHDDVFAYLREVGAPICKVYQDKVQAPECATCPAWWNEGRNKYLKAHHPGLHARYREKLAAVASEILPHWLALQKEAV
jgi:phosphoadenosine phosphosulfate reductase